MSGSKSFRLALCAALCLLSTAPAVSRAEIFRADYLVSYYPPNPCGETCSFADYTLDGTLSLFFQPAPEFVPILIGRTSVIGVALNETRDGSLSFELNLSDGPGDLLLSFGGDLVGKSPGPPTMPLYAFPWLSPGPPGSDPGSAPLINLGVISTELSPGPPSMPLYAFGSVHEVGWLSVTVTAIPEPKTYALMLTGLGIMGFIGRRRRKAS